uniref:Transcriptional regulator, MarR family n=1 Tax=uncultured Armatimonadetes bacterium TaxID=157466 RepID=A0A6J4HWL3_9BACT|nr:Transcriptional regulator, MarR family [uncultured Armatimonadetes bacterium]
MGTEHQSGTDGFSQEGQELERALFGVMRALVFRDDAHLPLRELPILQVRCLFILSRHPGMKMNELAEKLEVKLPAASQIADRLVRRGLVKRSADPDDRRVVRLSLTEEALGILAKADALRRSRLSATLRNLDAEAFGKALDGLRLLAAAAEQVEDGPSRPANTLSSDVDPVLDMMTRRPRPRRPAATGVLNKEQ